VWLYIDRVHLQPDHSGYDAEYWLNRNAYQINGFWFDGHELIEYLPPGDSLARRPESSVWPNGIALVSVGQPAEPIQAGQGLRIEFEFKRVGPITEDYYWFAHLVRADGKVIPGRDGGPQYGGAPTLLWAEGESITDKRAIAIPLDASPGSYTLYAGFISTTTGERVPLTYPDGRPSTDHVELGAVQILPRSAR
jgi:hypothetical protein